MMDGHSEAKLSKVDPLLAKVIRMAFLTSPYVFTVSQGLRTLEEQEALYAQGRTKPGKIVTWTMDSKHLTGRAVDIAVFVGGKIIWDEWYYDEMSKHILSVARHLDIAVEWGGTFPKPDRPHYQIDDKA